MPFSKLFFFSFSFSYINIFRHLSQRKLKRKKLKNPSQWQPKRLQLPEFLSAHYVEQVQQMVHPFNCSSTIEHYLCLGGPRMVSKARTSGFLCTTQTYILYINYWQFTFIWRFFKVNRWICEKKCCILRTNIYLNSVIFFWKMFVRCNVRNGVKWRLNGEKRGIWNKS